jgi:hypothetical protein
MHAYTSIESILHAVSVFDVRYVMAEISKKVVGVADSDVKNTPSRRRSIGVPSRDSGGYRPALIAPCDLLNGLNNCSAFLW